MSLDVLYPPSPQSWWSERDYLKAILLELRFANLVVRERLREEERGETQRHWKAMDDIRPLWDPFNLSARARHALVRAELTPDAVRGMSELELRVKTRNVGRKTAAEIMAAVK